MNAEEYVIERIKHLEQENKELNKQITDLNWCISRRETVANTLVDIIGLRVSQPDGEEGYITCNGLFSDNHPQEFEQAKKLIDEVKKWKKC